MTDSSFVEPPATGGDRPFRRFSFGSSWRLVTITIAACLICCEAAIATGIADVWALPKPPDPSVLSAGFPQCDDKQILATLRKCGADLRFFNSATLDGYNRANEVYVRHLKRFDSRLERAHGANEISGEQYAAIHDALKDALDDATSTDGAFRSTYRSWLRRYQEAARQNKADIDVCIVSPACQL